MSLRNKLRCLIVYFIHVLELPTVINQMVLQVQVVNVFVFHFTV
jgi:hypothetical protein